VEVIGCCGGDEKTNDHAEAEPTKVKLLNKELPKSKCNSKVCNI